MSNRDAFSHDLVLEREVPVSAENLWNGWTNPDVIVKWFTPKPWVTTEAEINLVPVGIFRTVMCGPDGERNEGDGCVLEVVAHFRAEQGL